MNYMIWCWLLCALFFLIIEIGQPGLFVCLSFSIGAVGSAFASWYGYSIVVQIITGLLITCLAIGCIYYWLRACGYMPKQDNRYRQYRSNVYALQGQKGVVIHQITPYTFGQVKLANGETWSAHSVDNEVIAIQTVVEVVRVRGAHLEVLVIK